MPLSPQENNTINNKPWLNFYGNHVPENMNFEHLTLVGLFLRAVKSYPEQTALNYKGYKVSYSLLKKMVDTFSCSLKKFGIKKGDCVGLMMSNVISFAVSYFATLKIGGVAVMVDPDCKSNDLEYILNDTGIKVIVTMDKMANQLISLRKRTKLERVIYTTTSDYLTFPQNKFSKLFGKQKKQNPGVTPARDLYAWKDIMSERPLIVGEESIAMTDIAMIHYTSGAGGKLKGAVLTQANLSLQVQQINGWFSGFKTGQERMLGAVPFCNPFGIMVCLNWPIINGWEVILVPRPDSDVLMKVMRKTSPGLFVMTPEVAKNLSRTPDVKKSDFATIRGCFLGINPASEDTIKAFETKSGVNVVQCFGISEASAITHIHPVSTRTRKIDSIGIPISDTECRISDFLNSEESMPVGQPGELLIRGPQVMVRYVGNAQECRRVLKDNWLHTGIVAYMDEDGFFYMVDRVRDMIISSGHNIYPREIDDVVHQHPKVSEACAVGIPHDQKGEEVKLFVVLKKGESASPEEFIDFCKDKIDPYKWPSQVEIREELPKSPVGGIVRQKLKEEELRRQH